MTNLCPFEQKYINPKVFQILCLKFYSGSIEFSGQSFETDLSEDSLVLFSQEAVDLEGFFNVLKDLAN